ncbi:hypothetical protein QAD02_001540 [Eretmocerus hayati]|uniref:Uncharacterized protein n=1 Tax=Eretmocerus hayati TaxID=131215 RepID=A0ACC2NGQ9_9HYME|nr:hypothetical protein QAD02_001540 [Eretmocerus hayati]
MEESERTVACDTRESDTPEDLTKTLADLPHIRDYVQKLQALTEQQQNELLELRTKLDEYEESTKSQKKTLNDVETQTDPWLCEETSEPQEWNVNQTDGKSVTIAQQVTEAAESAMQQTGFVYEETTGLYYHYESGYYYDSKSGLYYNGSTGTYYYYDKDSKSYKFHSQIQEESRQESDLPPTAKKNGRRRRKEKKKVLDDINELDKNKRIKLKLEEKENTLEETEEGECSESEESSESDDSSTSSNSDQNLKKNQDIARVYPPCMRIIVKETNLTNLKVGSLFIVTFKGGTIGREGDHAVIVPDINISKHHAKLQYDEVKKFYEIIDLGSRNGTFLNGKRISAAKQESDPTEIIHGSILQLGLTKLLCHIHHGHDTCGHCEPGLVQIDSTAEENCAPLKTKHHKELKRLKSKFGLEQDNSESASRLASGYQDRAQSRREKVGSSSQHVKTQQSSLHESIPKDNMGFKMLSKMGWSEGTSLGKSGDGAKEPVSSLEKIHY